MSMRRCSTILLAIGVLSVAPIGCGGGTDDEPAAGKRTAGAELEPTPADVGDGLIVALLGDADGFLPPVQQQAPHSGIMTMLMPGLLDSFFEDGRLSYGPYLAQKWEFSADGKSITFFLRDDVNWQDGTPVTAEDVRFTIEIVGDESVASQREVYLQNMDKKEPVTVLDRHTVRFNFQWPYNKTTMLAHAAGVETIPMHLLRDADRTALRRHPLHIEKPVGHGPFKMDHWKHGEEIVIVRNPECKVAPVPYLTRVVFRIIDKYQTQLQELKNGTVDMIQKVEEKDLERVASWPNVKLYTRGYRFVDYIGWNLKNELFQDKRVRHALTMAIDIQRMIDTLLTFGGKTYGVPAYGTITPELKDYRMEDLRLLPHDPAKAKELLAEAGWTDSDGDGWLDKDGKRFEFRLVTNTANPRRADAVVFVQQDLKKVGIKVNIEKREVTTFFDDLRNKNFEACLAGWSAGLFVDPAEIWGSPTPERPKPFNHCSYSDPRVDELIEIGLKTQDLEEEKRCWREMQRIIYEDQPYTFLYWRGESFAVDKRVRGIRPNILSLFYKMEEWWVPKAEHKYDI